MSIRDLDHEHISYNMVRIIIIIIISQEFSFLTFPIRHNSRKMVTWSSTFIPSYPPRTSPLWDWLTGGKLHWESQGLTDDIPAQTS
jgi:hypothetical protein